MSLSKQIHIYSVDTSFFYNNEEMKIHNKLNKTFRFRSKIKNKLEKPKKLTELEIEKLQHHFKYANQRIKMLKEKLYILFPKNDQIRKLNNECVSNRHIISVFESVLTRTLNIPENSLSKDILVVQAYFFQILEDIIKNGFMWNDEKYIVFTASAGQIRTKKTVFIKESVWKKHQLSLTCGLTIDSINDKGGMNVNKFLAYLALCNSATDEWKDFDIDKSIVVDDMCTTVRSLVDFIDDKTYEITRQEMDIEIEHMDGCGIMLPSMSKKSFMVRLPFVKGLLTPFAFDKFIRKANRENPKKKHEIVKDIYGKEYDIFKDDIQIIFTKSQFKMAKYYSSWDEYKENFKKHNCQAGTCNLEEDTFSNAKLNYQMLQTLTDMTDEELDTLCENTKKDIVNISVNKKTMMKVLGVVESNTRKNYLQQSLEIYPELLRDTYSKEVLKQVKKSLVREARSGKLNIEGVYTFIIPDLYAFAEYLFLGEKQPKGLLENGEIFCNIYPKKEKLDCLRAPHLYKEHAVRKNVIDKEKNKWFITKGLYTSVHDPISKFLMFDVDGDKSLVCADDTVISVAERNMKDVVPLFYNMAKANAENITNESIYDGLRLAYTGGNIGQISNEITKIWNSSNPSLEAVKILVMENNFVIDYAKTLYKPTRPKEINSLITEYTRQKTPHFFIYAKNKDKDKVEEINESVVNRLQKKIPNPILNFKRMNLGEFDYKKLMSNPDVEIDQQIIDKYTELDLSKRFMDLSTVVDGTSDGLYIYHEIRNQILEINSDVKFVTDVLIEYLYNHKKSNYKTTLWSSFGDVILNNLNNNIEIDERPECEVCGVKIEVTSNRKKYCDGCAKEIKLIQTRKIAKISMRKLREMNNVKKIDKNLQTLDT